jgi:hypothetical protein
MGYAEILSRALGPAYQAIPVLPQDLASLSGTVPDPLIELWQSDGWAGYGKGLFWTIDPRHLADLLPRWPLMPTASMCFGRDAFANLYLLSDGMVYQYNVHRDEPDMVAMELDLFIEVCLDDSEFRKSYMWSDLFDEVLKRLPPLRRDECYAFFPALALGGSVDAASLRSVKYYEHLEFLVQANE